MPSSGPPIYADAVSNVEGVPGAGSARWSILLGALIAAGFAALTVATVVGSPVADDGAGMHFALALTLTIGLGLAMFAFALAIGAKVQQQTTPLLWLPLLVLPCLVLYMVLGTRF